MNYAKCLLAAGLLFSCRVDAGTEKIACTKYSRPDKPVAVTVLKVVDGDTVDLVPVGGQQPFRMRLAEIDAPEARQPFGEESKRLLTRLVQSIPVSASLTDCDRYGRFIGYLRGNDGVINTLLVKYGGAWFYPEYSNDAGLYEIEQVARKNQTGLWGLPVAQRLEPWVWRKRQRAQ